MTSRELKRIAERLKGGLAVQQRESALKDHALKMTKLENHKLKIAVARLRGQRNR